MTTAIRREMRTKVVGVTFRNEDGSDRQGYIRRLHSGDPLYLKREPDNKKDPDAVAVLDGGRHQIGHIGRSLAAQLAPVMDGGCRVSAEATEVTGGTAERPSMGVNDNKLPQLGHRALVNKVLGDKRRQPWRGGSPPSWQAAAFKPVVGPSPELSHKAALLHR